MRALLVTLVVLVVVAASELSLSLAAKLRSNSHEWALYKRAHGKSYASLEEEARRFANYLNTKAQVERHNAEPSHSYQMALNHMADWTKEELAMVNGLKVDESQLTTELSAEHEAYLSAILGDDSEEVPAEVDWRKVPGRVSDVKNQGHCGSCWAFATTGVLEGQQVPLNLTQNLIELSEQMLMDCSSSNYACDGGLMKAALEDINGLGGIMKEADYPYVFDQQHCAFNKSKAVMSDTGAVVMTGGDEKRLQKLVAKFGPVSTAMFATETFQRYQKGVWSREDCPPNKLNHGVLIVGYGTDSKLGDFWLIKNSWGKKWGEEGYFRIKRGSNLCGIATMPTIPKF